MELTRPNWNCAMTEDRLSDYLDGLLGAEERAAFEAHRASCEACAALVARVGGAVQSLHALPAVVEPSHLVYAILDATLGPREAKAGWRGWFRWLRLVWQPQFAYGALTVLVTIRRGLSCAGRAVAEADARRPESGGDRSQRKSPRASRLREKLKICFGPANRLRDSIPFAAGTGA